MGGGTRGAPPSPGEGGACEGTQRSAGGRAVDAAALLAGEDTSSVVAMWGSFEEPGTPAGPAVASGGLPTAGVQPAERQRPEDLPLGKSPTILPIPPADIRRQYSFGKVLGQGRYGVIRCVRHRASGTLLAAKSISKESLKVSTRSTGC